MKVGSKVWARLPQDDQDERAEKGGNDQWVPGRVLLHRVNAGRTQMKISLDGYDSETDEWVDCDSEKVRPYEAHADSKEAARQDTAEKERSRLYAEQRKRDDRRELEQATAGEGKGLLGFASAGLTRVASYAAGAVASVIPGGSPNLAPTAGATGSGSGSLKSMMLDSGAAAALFEPETEWLTAPAGEKKTPPQQEPRMQRRTSPFTSSGGPPPAVPPRNRYSLDKELAGAAPSAPPRTRSSRADRFPTPPDPAPASSPRGKMKSTPV